MKMHEFSRIFSHHQIYFLLNKQKFQKHPTNVKKKYRISYSVNILIYHKNIQFSKKKKKIISISVEWLKKMLSSRSRKWEEGGKNIEITLKGRLSSSSSSSLIPHTKNSPVSLAHFLDDTLLTHNWFAFS